MTSRNLRLNSLRQKLVVREPRETWLHCARNQMSFMVRESNLRRSPKAPDSRVDVLEWSRA